MPYLEILVLLASMSLSHGQDLSSVSPEVQKDIFNIANGVPFTKSNTDETVNVDPDKIQFYLFSNGDTKNYELITSSNASAVDSNVRIIFLIHGWLNDRTCEWYQLFTEALFEQNSEYNIIQVDYSHYSKSAYVIATSNAEGVGTVISNFIGSLIQENSVNIDNILLIGHSLGGQIGGFVGKKVQENINEKLPRFVALDPAGPIFEQGPKKKRLNKNDYEFVNVIHSNGGFFGMKGECGTIDFYLNGGNYQPACVADGLKSLTEVDGTVFCSHSRSWKVYVSSIWNQDKFLAQKLVGSNRDCESKKSCSDEFVNLGDIDTDKTGNYYVKTTSEEPFYEK